MKRFSVRALMAAAAALLACGLWLVYLRASGNFHSVIDGEVYRSAQPDGAELSDWVRRHGIASVVNLRGASPGAAWYEEELAAARDLGLAHYDFPMSAARVIGEADADSLLSLLRDAPKPLLIHCKSGADRTGLVSALYLAAIAGRGEEEAEWQLSLLYGHIGLWRLSHAWPMNVSWEDLEPWLGFAES